jgi:hypothetical protein
MRIAVPLTLLALLAGCRSAKPGSAKPLPPEPVAWLDSLRWETSEQGLTLHASGRVPSTGYGDAALVARPRTQPGVREYALVASPPPADTAAGQAVTPVTAFLTFSGRSSARFVGVRVHGASALLELPTEPAYNPPPRSPEEVRARLALAGQTPAAYVDAAAYTAEGFLPFARSALRPRTLDTPRRLRVEADPGLDTGVLRLFELAQLDAPIRYRLPTGESFDAVAVTQDPSLTHVRLNLLRINDQTIATIQEHATPAAEAAAPPDLTDAVRELGRPLVGQLRSHLNERPAAIVLTPNPGVPFADLVTAARSAQAAGARALLVRPAAPPPPPPPPPPPGPATPEPAPTEPPPPPTSPPP